MAEVEEYDDELDEFLGSFGSNTNLAKRQKAEKLAALRPDDRRRKTKNRERQLNVKASDETLALVSALAEKFARRDGQRWSQPDIVEAAIASLAKTEQVHVGGVVDGDDR